MGTGRACCHGVSQAKPRPRSAGPFCSPRRNGAKTKTSYPMAADPSPLPGRATAFGWGRPGPHDRLTGLAAAVCAIHPAAR